VFILNSSGFSIRVHLFGIDLFGDMINYEGSFVAQGGGFFGHFSGQGRIVGYLANRSQGGTATLAHLDYPGVTVQPSDKDGCLRSPEAYRYVGSS